MNWHGYEQHPDAHPTRPWWRRVITAISHTPGWEREPDHYFVADLDADHPETGPTTWEDFTAENEPALAAVDAEHPLPPPPPKCGQVWVWPAPAAVAVMQRSVVSVCGLAAVWSPLPWLDDHPPIEWPPSGAVLVAGPHSPWAPPEVTP